MELGDENDRKDPPFNLPLDRATFADALGKGLGRVFLHVERFGATGLVDLIVGASIEDQSWDRPCMPPRGAWIRDLAFAAGCLEDVEEALCEAVAEEDGDSDLLDSQHRRDVLRHLARAGSEGALRAIETGLRLDRETGSVIGDYEFVNLAGARAVVAISEFLALELREDDEWIPDEHLREFDILIEQEGAARRVLDEAAQRSELVAEYLEILDAGVEEGEEEEESWSGDEDEDEDGAAERCEGPMNRGLAAVGRFELPDAPEQTHELIQDLLEKLERNPDARARRMLEVAYDRTPCVHCRSAAADLLGRLGLVPDWMVEELVFDVRNFDED